MQHATVRGKLRYTSRKPSLLDKVRGGETFIITCHADGSSTLRTHNVIDEDSPRVLRDVILNLDAQSCPTDAFTRITVDDRFVGSSWYRFTPELAECEGSTFREGRFSSRFELERPIQAFVAHPMQGDAFLVRAYDLANGPGTQEVHGLMMSSFHHRGADGPLLLRRPAPLTLTFIGEERISVEAGTFESLHFRIGTNTDDHYMGEDRHPPYHLWVTADGNYAMLKAEVTGYMQTYYELTEYQTGPGFF